MRYLKCPTCKEMLGNKYMIYDEQIELIDNMNISEEEKDKKKQKLISDLVELYCCKPRLMTACNLVTQTK